MDSSQNFTSPGGTTDPTNTRGTGDNGEVWNPTGGPGGTGAWEQPAAAAPVHHTADPFFGAVWGNRNQDTVNGKLVSGTSGAELDQARYQRMAGENVATPTIDQTASNESRGLSMGALGMLGARASGAQTPADALAAQQTTGAVNGLYSGAASIKGGAGSRAAAARGAIAQGAQVQAQGNQDAAALHARGIADASGQYFGAADAQRSRDLGLATAQAGLAQNQRGQNQQSNQFFEGLGWNTKNAQQQAGLGLSLSDQAAANAGRQAAFQANQAQWGRGMDVASGAGGLTSGAVSAYNSSQGDTPSATDTSSGDSGGGDDPWKDYSGSDPREKTAIHPVSDKEPSRLSRVGEGMLSGMRAGLTNGPSVGAPAYGGKYLPSPFFGAAKPSLDDAIAARVAADNAAPQEQRYGQFDIEEGGARRPGYAASRVGQAGAMFGPAPIVTHGYEAAPVHFGARGQRDREVAMSDPAAKQQAYDLGVARGLSAGPETRNAPAGITGVRANQNTPTEGRAASTSAERKDPSLQRRVVSAREQSGENGREAIVKGLALAPFSPVPAAGLVLGGSNAAYHAEGPNQAPIPAAPTMAQAAPQPPAEPSYFGQIANRAKTALSGHTPSDPRTKQGVKDSPMADANRSMAPSVYEYKAEFTPPEQQAGEKNVGPMANKMEANPVAATAIVKDPNTGLLAIDKTKGLKLVMGGLADLQRQVDQMKGHAR